MAKAGALQNGVVVMIRGAAKEMLGAALVAKTDTVHVQVLTQHFLYRGPITSTDQIIYITHRSLLLWALLFQSLSGLLLKQISNLLLFPWAEVRKIMIMSSL